MSLLLSMLSRLVITFLPRSKCLLISWLQMVTAAMKVKDTYLLLGRKAMTNPDSILKSRDVILPTKVHPYMTTGKTIALTRRTFVGKVMSLLLNMLCRLIITFLPRSKRLLISWLQSPSAAMKLKDACSLEGKL